MQALSQCAQELKSSPRHLFPKAADIHQIQTLCTCNSGVWLFEQSVDLCLFSVFSAQQIDELLCWCHRIIPTYLFMRLSPKNCNHYISAEQLNHRISIETSLMIWRCVSRAYQVSLWSYFFSYERHACWGWVRLLLHLFPVYSYGWKAFLMAVNQYQ